MNFDMPEKDLTYDGARDILLTDYPGMDLLFSKEMAVCLPDSMYLEVSGNDGKFTDFTHSFLIRDPERAIYSYYKGVLTEGDQTLIFWNCL